MLTHWEQIGEFEVTEQRRANQARQIRTDGWMSELELEEIKRTTKEPLAPQGESNFDCTEQQAVEQEHVMQPDPSADKNNKWMVHDFSVELAVVKRLRKGAQDLVRQRFPALRATPRHKLLIETRKINDIIANIHKENTTVTNDQQYASSIVITERLGIKIGSKYKKERVNVKKHITC